MKIKALTSKLTAKIPATWKEKTAQYNHALKFQIKSVGWFTFLAEATIFPIFLLLVWVLLILLNGVAV